VEHRGIDAVLEAAQERVDGEEALGYRQAGGVVTTRSSPSTADDTMPGNHSHRRAGSPTSSQTSSAGASIRFS